MNIEDLSIGYVPYSNDFQMPGDRRRFVYYAKKKGINFEIASPSKEYDIVYVTHGADISIWSQYNKSEAIVIYELIDSYLSVPFFSFSGLFKGLAKYFSGEYKKITFSYHKTVKLMCKRADIVVCSTEEQKEVISEYCSNVQIILDFKTMYRNYKVDYSIGKTLDIVWEGLPHNIKSFSILKEAFSSLSNNYQVNLHLITNLEYKKYMNKYIKKYAEREVKKYIAVDEIYLYQWNELTVSHIASACDLAIIPIDLNNPMDYGKPENKLLIFWLMGIPTLVSSTPAHLRAMSEAGLPMPCESTSDWIESIEYIINNKETRIDSAQKGFAHASNINSEERIMSLWDDLFNFVKVLKQ